MGVGECGREDPDRLQVVNDTDRVIDVFFVSPAGRRFLGASDVASGSRDSISPPLGSAARNFSSGCVLLDAIAITEDGEVVERRESPFCEGTTWVVESG